MPVRQTGQEQHAVAGALPTLAAPSPHPAARRVPPSMPPPSGRCVDGSSAPQLTPRGAQHILPAAVGCAAPRPRRRRPWAPAPWVPQTRPPSPSRARPPLRWLGGEEHPAVREAGLLIDGSAPPADFARWLALGRERAHPAPPRPRCSPAGWPAWRTRWRCRRAPQGPAGARAGAPPAPPPAAPSAGPTQTARGVGWARAGLGQEAMLVLLGFSRRCAFSDSHTDIAGPTGLLEQALASRCQPARTCSAAQTAAYSLHHSRCSRLKAACSSGEAALAASGVRRYRCRASSLQQWDGGREARAGGPRAMGRHAGRGSKRRGAFHAQAAALLPVRRYSQAPRVDVG